MGILKINNNTKSNYKTDIVENPEIIKYLNSLNYIKNDNDLEMELSRLRRNSKWMSTTNNNILLMGDVQSGKTNNLIYSAYSFFSSGYNICIYLAATKNAILHQNSERFTSAMSNFLKDVRVIKPGNRITKNHIRNAIDEKTSLVIATLKRPDTLDNIFESMISFKDKIKLFIINDEGDESSFSIKNKELLKSEEKINFLKKINNNTKYINITATPFRNIMHDKSFSLSSSYTLESPKNYTDLAKFKNNYIVYDDWKRSILDSVVLFINCIYEKNLKNQQILFNIFSTIKGHNEIEKYIDKIIGAFRTKDVGSKEKLSKTIYEAEEVLSLNHLSMNIYFSFFNNDNFKKIVTNSQSETELMQELSDERHQLIIGGFNLSRGITFVNLLVENLLNEPKGKQSITVLLQRARWLGYRQNYKDIKIFVTERIKESYSDIVELIDMTKKFINNKDISRDNYKKYIKNLDKLKE